MLEGFNSRKLCLSSIQAYSQGSINRLQARDACQAQSTYAVKGVEDVGMTPRVLAETPHSLHSTQEAPGAQNEAPGEPNEAPGAHQRN